jgi:glycosyltransferase involved in cell wall biosynthesis
MGQGSVLVDIVRALSASDFSHIIVVNDGSLESGDPVFEEVKGIDKVSFLKHAVDLGKGAALKTGLIHAYCNFGKNVTVVTVDADGQHLPEDVFKVARRMGREPGNLVLGVRSFGRDVPLRSKLGNNLTRHLFTALVGQKLTDTQAGLRGIPGDFIPHLLKLDSRGMSSSLTCSLPANTGAGLSWREPIAIQVTSSLLEAARNKEALFSALLPFVIRNTFFFNRQT